MIPCESAELAWLIPMLGLISVCAGGQNRQHMTRAVTMHLQTSHLTRVVALFLSMNELIQAKPMGYDYPTPAVPFIEGPVSTTSPAPSPDYDDYDPNDVPSDQAAPDTSEKGYEYPVPQNPLVLPTKPPRSTTTTSPPLPECIPVEERDLGMNLDLLEAGVPLCPDYEEYNPEDIPEDQAPPAPDCVPADQAGKACRCLLVAAIKKCLLSCLEGIKRKERRRSSFLQQQ